MPGYPGRNDHHAHRHQLRLRRNLGYLWHGRHPQRNGSFRCNSRAPAVKFCDASAAHCEDSALVATAQLTPAGTATYKFRPGIGGHSYKAVFIGTTSYAKSGSTSASLSVTGCL